MSILPTPTILIPALPPKTFIGINLVTFTSTANFHGIRDLPSGWHFLYSGSTEALSLRSGGWFYVTASGAGAGAGAAGNKGGELALTRAESAPGPAPEVFIWKWDSDTETLVPLKGDNDAERQEVLRYKANLGVVWQAGGLFRFRSVVSPSQTKPQAQTQTQQDEQAQAQEEEEEEREAEGRRNWADLTRYLSPSLLSRITGEAEVDADARPRWMVTSASTALEDSDDIPGLASSNPAGTETSQCANDTVTKERDFAFLPIELKRTWREGATGRERTEAAQDRSWALGDLIKRYSITDTNTADEREGELQILGELQFTFLMALTLLNFSCLQQWKRLLQLILTCRGAISEREGFMRNVIRLLLLQLQRCDDLEGGLFAIDGDEGGEFLQEWLVKFARSVDEVVLVGAGSAVKTELDKLGAWVKDEYGWELHPEGIVRRGMLRLEDGEEVEMDVPDDEDEETGEYAATVVDLGERF